MSSNTILNPDQFEILEEEVEEERALTMLADFFDKVWARLDDNEPTVDDYYNYM